MSTAAIYYNGRLAGRLTKAGSHYVFTYDAAYVATAGSRPVSLTLPLRTEPYKSDMLFPLFINLLSEGANKAIQDRLLKIDENDYFGLLLATGVGDRVGPLTIKEETDSHATT
jgi:HipA-like protein